MRGFGKQVTYTIVIQKPLLAGGRHDDERRRGQQRVDAEGPEAATKSKEK